MIKIFLSWKQWRMFWFYNIQDKIRHCWPETRKYIDLSQKRNLINWFFTTELEDCASFGQQNDNFIKHNNKQDHDLNLPFPKCKNQNSLLQKVQNEEVKKFIELVLQIQISKQISATTEQTIIQVSISTLYFITYLVYI